MEDINMNLSNEVHTRGGKWPIVLGIISIILSILAVSFTGITAYKNLLKPFELAIRIDQAVQIQHKGNFGLYLNADFFNKSPQNGLITQLAVILYRTNSREDKYLLELSSFRVLNEDNITYSYSQEKLPIFSQPWQRNNKTMSFIYQREEGFPISTGTYICELLIWIDDSIKPKYVKEIKFEITTDVFNLYSERRKAGSVTLEPTNVVGYTPLKSKKLTDEEYKRLH